MRELEDKNMLETSWKRIRIVVLIVVSNFNRLLAVSGEFIFDYCV